MPVQGVGALTVENLLEDVSYALFQPVVNTTITTFTVPAGYGDGGFGDGGYGDGTGLVVTVGSVASMYVGAQVIVGLGLGTEEVVTITQVDAGDFVAAFVNAHNPGEIVVGATFPYQNAAGDPMFLQSEMLGYVSEALNDFLLRVPLVIAVTTSISMPPTQPFTALPSDCMKPVRVAAFGVGLRESSQSNLDGCDWRWQQETGNPPQAYYRDKIGLQQVGVWPVQSNQVPLEITYSQRSPQLLGLADGFLFPDVFLVYIKARVLSTAYSKDGEQRSPALSKFWSDRYENGIKISQVILEVIQDTSMQ
jgi:hypothetical protein